MDDESCYKLLWDTSFLWDKTNELNIKVFKSTNGSFYDNE